MKKCHVAILGATGLVGEEAISILDSLDWPIEKLGLFASARSKGRTYRVHGKEWTVQDIDEISDPFKGYNVALFSAGSAVSKVWAERAVQAGCWVVDNSSAFRMDSKIELVTMPVNGQRVRDLKAKREARLIANPNCSTIQLVWPLKALQDAFGLEDVIVSSYQAVSGAGATSLKNFMGETRSLADMYWDNATHHFPYDGMDRYGLNVVAKIGDFNQEGYSQEEWKIMTETRKIMGLPKLPVSATAVRVPVTNGHSESVTVTLSKDFSLPDVKSVLTKFPGIRFYDTERTGDLPTPRALSRTDLVGVGRIRRDPNHNRRLHFWVVADNLRVGAATNAIQIMQEILS